MCCILAVLLGGEILGGRIEAASTDAQKVNRLINKIKAAERDQSKQGVRKETVLEREVNAYLADLVKKERDPVITQLRVSLFKGNLIRGTLIVDLAGLGLALLLPIEMHLEFEGVLETRKGQVRFSVHRLLLGEQPVEPDILNLIIAAVADLNQVEPVAVDQWHTLPYGIETVETRRGAAIVHY